MIFRLSAFQVLKIPSKALACSEIQGLYVFLSGLMPSDILLVLAEQQYLNENRLQSLQVVSCTREFPLANLKSSWRSKPCPAFPFIPSLCLASPRCNFPRYSRTFWQKTCNPRYSRFNRLLPWRLFWPQFWEIEYDDPTGLKLRMVTAS